MAEGMPPRDADVALEIDEDNVVLADFSRWRWDAGRAAWVLMAPAPDQRHALAVVEARESFAYGASLPDVLAGEPLELPVREADLLVRSGRAVLA